MDMKYGGSRTTTGNVGATEMCSEMGDEGSTVGTLAKAGGRSRVRLLVPASKHTNQASRQCTDLPSAVIAVEKHKTSSVLSPVSQRRHSGEADLGWAAGVMDGEGCIHIARQTYGASGRRPTYRLRLNISQNDELLLREFCWAVGVQGRLYSPKPTGKQNRTCHSLIYDGVSAFTVLERLHKYLRRKKAQSALATEFREQCDIHRHTGPNGCPQDVWDLREWYYERMSSMKRA